MALFIRSKARILLGLVILVMQFGFANVSPVAAMSANTGAVTANSGGQSSVECPKGKLVVNVTEKVLNDLGYASYYNDVSGLTFAIQKYNRHIQAWQVGPGVYCAEVTYDGSFVTVAGVSPGDPNLIIAAGIKGEFKGRYVATTSGLTPNPNPIWRPRGNAGTFDYACNPDTFDCPGYVNWYTVFFTGYDPNTFNYTTHDFLYRTAKNGTFFQHLDTFEGNITNGKVYNSQMGVAKNAAPSVQTNIQVRP